MKLVWNLPQQDKVIEVKLVYNMYLGIKKLYADGKQILLLRKPTVNNISFQLDGKEYNLVLVPEDYGYTGELITSEGTSIAARMFYKEYSKTPIWIIPFAIINMAIPIISVEALTPWIIGAAASYFTAFVSKRSGINIKLKLAISAAISVLAWTAYYVFYLTVMKFGFKGGFIPFIK